MPPRVIYSKSEGTEDLNKMSDEEKKVTGGWVLANSMSALTTILKRWNIDPNFWCEPRGKPSKFTFIMFISELRLTLTMRTQAQLMTKHELFAFGRQKSKKDSRSEAAVSMMRQLYKFGIAQAAYQSLHRPGKNASLWEIKLGLQGAPYEPDDIYVTDKLNSLRPDPEELLYPSTVVSHIEAALKCVSDWLHEEEIAEEYTSALNNRRTLLGMQRVGPIAMDMMLTGERRAHVVLTCGRRPTRKLLEMVAGKTIQMLQYTSRGFIPHAQLNKDIQEYHKAMDEAEEQAKAEAALEEVFKKAAEKLKKENEDAEKQGENAEENEGKEDDTGAADDDEGEEVKQEEVQTINQNTNNNNSGWETCQQPSRPDPEYYTIAIEHGNSGFIINYGIITPRKMTVRVTLTSSLIRDDVMLKKKQEKEEAEAKAKKEAEEEPKKKKIKKEAVEDDGLSKEERLKQKLLEKMRKKKEKEREASGDSVKNKEKEKEKDSSEDKKTEGDEAKDVEETTNAEK